MKCRKRMLSYAVVISLVMSSCSTLTNAEKAEREAQKTQSVEKALAERQYAIEIHMMYPRHGMAVNVTPDYSLQVKGDTLVSYLPYIGRAYNVPYGGGKGMNFKAPIREYQAVKGRKGSTQILIGVDNEEDILTYTLHVSASGSTSIDVSSRNREAVSYSGQMDTKK